MPDTTVRVEYIGAVQNFSEVTITGNQQVWRIGSSAFVETGRASQLVASGKFRSLANDPAMLPANQAKVGAIPSGSGVKFLAGDTAIKPVLTNIESSKRLLVQMSGGAIFVRYAWDATWDAVQKILIDQARTANANNPVDLGGCRKIPIATADADTASVWAGTGASNPLAAQGDDAPPMKYNGTWMGGNHGASVIKQCVVTGGHGKTDVDIGSLWDGPYTPNYIIARIIDANTLWMFSAQAAGSQNSANNWGHEVTTITAYTWPHVADATNTAGFTVATSTTAQLTPALNNRSLRFFVDGAEVNSIDAVYRCARFEVREQYGIVNPPAVWNWLRSNVGKLASTWTPPDSLDTDATVKNTWAFGENGACVNNQETTFNKHVTLDYIGGVQGIAPYYSGKTLSAYVPGVSAVTAGATYDFKAVAALTTAPSSDANLAAASWLDSKSPPNRMLHLVSNGGTNEFGSLYGFSPIRGATGKVSRPSKVDTAGFISSARKWYPKGVTGSAFALNIPTVGAVAKVTAYRHIYNCAAAPDATVASWFWDGSDIIVSLDFHKTSALSTIQLPAVSEGWAVTPIDVSNVTLFSPVVDGGQIGVACTASYGYAQYRVSAT